MGTDASPDPSATQPAEPSAAGHQASCQTSTGACGCDPIGSDDAAVRRHLRRRHAADKRFKIYCVAALCIAFTFLALFFIDIIRKGYPAFRQARIRTTITYNEETVGFEKLAVPEPVRELVSRGRLRTIPREGLRSQLHMKLRYPEQAGGDLSPAELLEPISVTRQRAQIRLPITYHPGVTENPAKALEPVVVERADAAALTLSVPELEVLLDMPALRDQLKAELAGNPELAGTTARGWLWASRPLDAHLCLDAKLELPHHLVILVDGRDKNGELDHRQVDESLTIPVDTLAGMIDAELLRARVATDLEEDAALASTVAEDVWLWSAPHVDDFVENGRTEQLTDFQVQLVDGKWPNGELGLRRAYDRPQFGEETVREELVLLNSEVDQYIKHYNEQYNHLDERLEAGRPDFEQAWQRFAGLLDGYLAANPEAVDADAWDPVDLPADNPSLQAGFLRKHRPGLQQWLRDQDRRDADAALSDYARSVLGYAEAHEQLTRIESMFGGSERIDLINELYASGQIRFTFNTGFLLNSDSTFPELAGMRVAIIGSVMVLLVVLAICFPIGVLTAIYLEEFAPDNWFTQIIEVNINNLAAIPSILFGLLGLAAFVNFFGMTRGAAMVGGLTLSLKVLPVVIISARAALRAVPDGIRLGAQAMGATRWQAVCHHVLPQSISGILTGAIIGLAQAMGETAPLIIVGMVAFITASPSGIDVPTTVMPAQIYLWFGNSQGGFEERAAAGILVMLAVLMSMNAFAIFLRAKTERRW